VHEKDSHFKELTEKGYQGGGPSWKGIVYGALKMSDPAILTKIGFDEEAEELAINKGNSRNGFVLQQTQTSNANTLEVYFTWRLI